MLLELKRFNIPLDHKVFLEDVTWQDFETLLEELGEHGASIEELFPTVFSG